MAAPKQGGQAELTLEECRHPGRRRTRTTTFNPLLSRRVVVDRGAPRGNLPRHRQSFQPVLCRTSRYGAESKGRTESFETTLWINVRSKAELFDMCFVHVAVQSSFASIRLVHVEPHLSHAFVHSAFQACCCLKRTSRDGSEHPQLLNQQLFEKTTAITMFRTVENSERDSSTQAHAGERLGLRPGTAEQPTSFCGRAVLAQTFAHVAADTL